MISCVGSDNAPLQSEGNAENAGQQAGDAVGVPDANALAIMQALHSLPKVTPDLQ